MAHSGPGSLAVEDLDLPVGDHRLRARWLIPEAHEPTPTLVFLHEGLGSIRQWKDFPAQLARRAGLRALVYDRLGHGASPPLTGPRTMDYLEQEAFEALPQVLHAAGIERPVLVGHSDGGTIALLFAGRFPEVPWAVITEAFHVFLEPVTLQGLRSAAEAYASGALRAGLARHHGDKVDALFRGWNGTWLDPASRDWDVTPWAEGIRAPLLMIQGEDDEYGSPAQIEAVQARVLGPVESWLIPGCGHVPHFQAGSAVLDRMAAFLGGLGKSR